MPLQIRRGTDAERTAMTQPLAAGELIFVTNTNRLWIGNGTTLGGVPVTDYSDEQARDIAASIFVAGTHNSITFAYDDALDKINATVDLSDYQGVIKAAAFNGSVVANDSSLLIDGNTGKFNLSGSVGTDILPDTDVAYDLGSATYRFRDLYLSGSSINLGAATITATGTAVNLPAGSTIGGSAIGIPGGDLNVNIVADDSTIIVNTTTEVVTAQGGFIGNLTGSIVGNVTGNVTGNINGLVIGTAGSSLVGNVTGNVNGIVTGTAGSSLVGNVTGNVNGIVTGTAGSSLVGNVTGNVIGDVIGNVSGDIKGSVFGQDSTMLVDATNSKLTGILASDLVETPDGSIGITFAANTSASFSASFHNGTNNVKLPISTGVPMGAISIKGWNGISYAFGGAILASFETGANLNDDAPISTITLASGAGGSSNKFASLNSNGIWLSPVTKTTVYSVAGTALPSAVTVGAGARAFVSDATATVFASAYTGGGANNVPVYSDGAVWRIG